MRAWLFHGDRSAHFVRAVALTAAAAAAGGCSSSTPSSLGTSGEAATSSKGYSGARVVSQPTYLYGAFEARLRAAPGGGFVTPFFLFANDSWKPGAEWQEMDIEIFGRNGTNSFQSQVLTPGNPNTQHIHLHTLPGNLANEFHTYRMEWTPQHLVWYFDGRLLREETDTVEYGKLLLKSRAAPMSIQLMNWAADNDWSGRFDPSAVPSNAFIRYVRAERYTPGIGAGGSDFTLDFEDDFHTFNWNRWSMSGGGSDGVNDYVRQNVSVQGGQLALSFTNSRHLGYSGGVVAPDPASPKTLPARLEATQFARYRDSTEGNAGGDCRMTDVDLQLSTDTNDAAPATCNVGWTTPGEWVEYDVVAPSQGWFDITLRLASEAAGKSAHVEVDNHRVGPMLVAPGTGWQSWQDAVAPAVPLSAGPHTLRVVFDSGDVNLHYVDVTRAE